jgi:hypothetical protein
MNIVADTTGVIHMLNGLQLQQVSLHNTQHTIQNLQAKQNCDYDSAIFYYQQAEEMYELALQSHPNNRSLLQNMAVCYASRVICDQIVSTKMGVCVYFSFKNFI